MAAVKKNTFDSFLAQHDERSWCEALDSLLRLIHPVDQDATRVWFAFWPLHLYRVIQQSDNLDQTAQKLEMKGRYLLEEQLDSSLGFLVGSQYWPEVKEAVCSHAESSTSTEGGLADQIRAIARKLASTLQVPESHLIGITAVALMALRQIGPAVFSATSIKAAKRKASPNKVLRARSRKRGRFFGFLHTVDSKYTVIFDEHDKASRFEAIHGQDISMAAGKDHRDYQSIDPRRIQGPVPFQCRTGTCGTCWIGVLSGKEKLSPISEFEKARLKYFGYDFGSSDQETHPPVRLSCQARCFGDVSIAIAPWNGVLNVRRFDP
ncbi:(2Fe-2S)-binding protein [Acidobacteria bacterium AH-259-A15]|nr:(2Fe-2S)-binding protein [Acidobacteria bacterium AH-259-A15]